MASESRFGIYAAALLVIAGLALAPLLFFPGERARIDVPAPIDETPVPQDTEPPIAEDAPVPARPEDPAPPEVLAAKDELRAEYAKQKGKMPEDVAKPIEDDIGVIEGAAADLLAAIANEPDNENLKMMLIETYRNEMKLLKKALHLSSADDDEVEKSDQ